MRFNPQIVKKGFNKLYTEVLKTSFSEKRWKNLEFVLSKIEDDESWTDYRHVSNFLAQVGHESAWSYYPVPEKEDKTRGKVWQLQSKYWHTGFYGRGYIQITHKPNYQKLSAYVGLDLARNPDLALQPDVSYTIAAKGMQLGLFTGKKLSDYINGSKCDYFNCRRIVNGTDRAKDIEYYSKCIDVILKTALMQETVSPRIDPREVEAPFIMDEDSAETGTTTVTTKTETITPEVTKVVEVEQTISAPTQQIEPVLPRFTSGIKAWKATLSGIIGSLGLGGAWTWITEKYNSLQQHTSLIIVVLVIAAIFGLVFYVMRERSKEKREARAHELTMEQLKIRANPNMTNVEVRQ